MPERPVVKRWKKGLCTRCGRPKEPKLQLWCWRCIELGRKRAAERSSLPGAPWTLTDELWAEPYSAEYDEYFE